MQKLNTAVDAYFDAEDAERDTRVAYEVLLSKRRRGTSHVSDADTTAGERRVTLTHARLLSARSELQDEMELLAAFQSSSFPEVSFHLCVAADGVGAGTGGWCGRTLHCIDTIAACRDRARLRSSGGTAANVSGLEILDRSGLLVQRSLKVCTLDRALRWPMRGMCG